MRSLPAHLHMLRAFLSRPQPVLASPAFAASTRYVPPNQSGRLAQFGVMRAQGSDQSGSGQKPTVRAGRRRYSAAPSSGERQRAEALDAPAGDSIVGFIVEALDGNQVASYQQITVQ